MIYVYLYYTVIKVCDEPISIALELIKGEY